MRRVVRKASGVREVLHQGRGSRRRSGKVEVRVGEWGGRRRMGGMERAGRCGQGVVARAPTDRSPFMACCNLNSQLSAFTETRLLGTSIQHHSVIRPVY